MRKYIHLTLEQREKMFAYIHVGKSLRWIAKRLGRSHSTLVREKKRHTRYGIEYIPCKAHKRARIIASRQRYKAPLKNPFIFLYVREHLRPPFNWSPETIAGRLSFDHPEYSIDDETIYRYIYGKKQKRMKLWKYLAHHRKKRMNKHGRKVKKYARLASAIPIQERPTCVNKRKIYGHWETDNMEGVKSDSTSISVSVERKTRMIRIRKLANHTSQEKLNALKKQWKQDIVQSVTVDRGPENSKLTKLKPILYACQPYHSWEKGSVENVIGRIRRYIPKKTSVDPIPESYLLALEEYYNNTPRKILGFLTPYEYLEKIRGAS
ncbi:IS30 family transposase [Patescibacteria group bacterium]